MLNAHLLRLITPFAGETDHGVSTDRHRRVLIRLILGRGCEPNDESVFNVGPQFELRFPLFHGDSASAKN